MSFRTFVEKSLASFLQFFKKFSLLMQGIVNFFLLIPVYLLGVGIVSLISRILGKHYLDLTNISKKSWWKTRDKRLDSEENYHRMF
jgi:hypothetical protein